MVIVKSLSRKRLQRWKLPCSLTISLAGAFLSASAFAEPDSDKEQIKQLELKLERSLKMIDDLSEKVKKLEAGAKPGDVQTADAGSRLAEVEQKVSQMVTGMASHSGIGQDGSGVPLHGFADVGFAANNRGAPHTDPKGFNLGSLVLFLTPQFGQNVKSLFEIAFGVHANGVVEEHVERLQIGYTFSDAATLWAGRFHTPYGYWNNAYHHGAQIQTSIMRPRFLDFEDHDTHAGVLPAHTVGLWATGKIKAGSGRFTYDAFLGNAPKLNVVNPGSAQTPGMLDPAMGGKTNYSPMVGLNAGYDFSGELTGLRLAAHWLGGDVDDNAVNGAGRFNRTGLNVAGGSAVYLAHELEVLGEYYRFDDKDKSGGAGSHTSWAGYAQFGKTCTNLTPFARLERAVLDQRDNYFSMQMSGQSYSRQVLGLKYDLEPKASLKLELSHSHFDAEPQRVSSAFNSLLGQYAIRF